jgi:Ras-related protein Rab-18
MVVPISHFFSTNWMRVTLQSSMLICFTDDAFYEHIQSTIGADFKVKHLKLSNKQIKLTVWDTAGQERFRTLTPLYYRGVQGVVMVYDVTRHNSFNNLEHWLKEVKLYSPNNGEAVVRVGLNSFFPGVPWGVIGVSV